MTILVLKSAKASGTFDSSRNVATIRGKEYTISPASVISAGDRIIIKGEEFAALNPEPYHFRDYARRTAQIIQPWDAAVILLYGGISPGKRVLESGAGSGALSAAILHAIGPDGKLTTVDIDRNNLENARQNVKLSLDCKNWTLIESSIEDFSSDEKFDCAVLDVPEPWGVVQKISKNIVSGGMVCCYSPTFNQLEKNVTALKKSGCLVLESVEILKREILVRENATRPDNDIIGHTAFMTFAVKLSGRLTKDGF